jgi:hypothetical protein
VFCRALLEESRVEVAILEERLGRVKELTDDQRVLAAARNGQPFVLYVA